MKVRSILGLGFIGAVLSTVAFGAEPEANTPIEEIVVTARYPAHLLMEEVVVTAPMPVNLLAEHSAGLTDEIRSAPDIRITL